MSPNRAPHDDDKLLRILVEGTAPATGDEFFRVLTKKLAAALDVAHAFVAEFEAAPNQRLRVTFDRRCHNPILREAALDQDSPPIPWLKNHRIEFDCL